jgi:hypothetical protein
LAEALELAGTFDRTAQLEQAFDEWALDAGLGRDPEPGIGRVEVPEPRRAEREEQPVSGVEVRVGHRPPRREHPVYDAHGVEELQGARLETQGAGGRRGRCGLVDDAAVTPRLSNSQASVRPVGPAPTIRTSVSCFAVDVITLFLLYARASPRA